MEPNNIDVTSEWPLNDHQIFSEEYRKGDVKNINVDEILSPKIELPNPVTICG